jgi:anhydro-N-acetylmuramic acid kinase
MQKYNAIGIMSGTSLDGLDLVNCEFTLSKDIWQYKIIKGATFTYTDHWQNKLQHAHLANGQALSLLHNEYGNYIGEQVNLFIKKNELQPGYICSHGHTIFHQPDKKMTFQLGNGHNIAAKTGLPVIGDFRSLDISLGGQGAPLVPVGDEQLFYDYDYCLNLGGIANVSFKKLNKRIAFDICPCNMIINYMANKTGKEYDKDGELARQGIINESLYQDLNNIAFYEKPPPKSLAREDIESWFITEIENNTINIATKLRTIYEHIAFQITRVFSHQKPQRILVTGGGTYNKFLMQLIQEKTSHQIVIPDPDTINFKEAIIFGFMGILKIRNEINCLSSVTGAASNSSGGVVYGAV